MGKYTWIIKWLYPGLKIKRWLLLALFGVIVFILGIALVFDMQLWAVLILVVSYIEAEYLSYSTLIFLGIFLMLIGIITLLFSLKKGLGSIMNTMVPQNEARLVETIYEKRQLVKGPSIVALGGGTGLPVVLKGLKKYTNNLTAVVAVTDDGGCSGKIRGELGIIPPGDLRDNLVALADKESLLKELLNYRFKQGNSLSGRSLGNLLIAALTDITGDVNSSVQQLSKVLAISGTVLPASLSSVTLKAVMEDGNEIYGETDIVRSGKKIKKMSIEPEDSEAMPEVIEAIKTADVVILGPGSLYTSVLTNLLIEKIAKALVQSKAKVYYVCNIMTQPGETNFYTASQHLQVLKKHVPGLVIDKTILNTQKISNETLKIYENMESELVIYDKQAFSELNTTVLTGDLLDSSDFVRHDSDKLAKLLMREILKDISARDKFKMADLILSERYKDLTG